MRKIIETVSTTALWVVFLSGSSLALADFFFNAQEAKKISAHLALLAWAPAIAVVVFVAMLLAVRFSKYVATKKTIPSEHALQWTMDDLAQAQTGKVVDLHFVGAGLACEIVTRDQVATVLHAENQTLYVKVVPQNADNSSAVALASQRM